MDNKKHNKLISQYHLYKDTNLESGSSINGPFGNNYACAHAYRKTEKLIIALHLVTNFVPEKEPARNVVRDKSLHILSDILQLRSGFRSTGSERLDHVIASVYEIISLLNILHVAGFISDMNLKILKNELCGLITFLRDAEDTEVSEKVTFDDSHFNTEEFTKRHNIKDSGMSFRDKRTIRTSLQNKRQNNVGESSTLDSHTKRHTAILNLVKDKKSINVKDISAVVTDCSEKTIQRELIALINKGILKKEGERRWSTYSLK